LSQDQSVLNKRILITGASGWIGQELLCLLQSKYESLENLDLTCTASVRKTLLIHGEKIECDALRDLSDHQQFDLIIHLAFLLPKESSLIPIHEYEETNIKILELAKGIFDSNPKALKLILSSGAVENPNKGNQSEFVKSYGMLKKNMELLLSDPQSLVIRLWSATGHHIPLDSDYALTEFIRTAKLNEDVLIKNNVHRSYVSLQELLDTALEFLYSGGRGTVNSGGFSISLSKLAETIIAATGSESIVLVENPKDSKTLDYVSPETELPKNYLSRFSSIEVQIEKTLNGN
jgi:nucleoside-diphosphate-sugar epimerase